MCWNHIIHRLFLLQHFHFYRAGLFICTLNFTIRFILFVLFHSKVFAFFHFDLEPKIYTLRIKLRYTTMCCGVKNYFARPTVWRCQRLQCLFSATKRCWNEYSILYLSVCNQLEHMSSKLRPISQIYIRIWTQMQKSNKGEILLFFIF